MTIAMSLRIAAVFSLLFIISTSATPHAEIQNVPSGIQPLSREMADFINSIDTTWKAGEYSGESLQQENLRSLLGTILASGGLTLPEKEIIVSNDLPAAFEARDKWANCPSIREIRDQSNCGSCWAFATAEVITDRTCIRSEGKFTDDLSAQDLLSCCQGLLFAGCGHGCQGGYTVQAFSYWLEHGLVTGGLFNGSGCQPYTFEPHHHGEDYGKTPECLQTCRNGADYEKDKHYGANAFTIRTADQMRQEIFDHGPILATFEVFSDFPSYKGGVYQKHSTQSLGGHAIKLVGWGEEDGMPFWIAANSWNTEWGEDGFFKILRGSNHCGIENGSLAGTPK